MIKSFCPTSFVTLVFILWTKWLFWIWWKLKLIKILKTVHLWKLHRWSKNLPSFLIGNLTHFHVLASHHISQRIQWNEGAKLRKTNELHLTFRLTLSEPSMSSLPTPIIHEIQDGWPPYDLSFLFSKIAHEN